MRRILRPPFAFLLLAVALAGQATTPPTPMAGSAELSQLLDNLNTLGSVLMLGAHPDDENTSVIAYFARGRHMRTAYLSANRGEGGQNLIGSEQGPLIGMIRTQELLAARHIDDGEQFFTRVIDFGYSKTPEEAIRLWGRDVLLGDMVRIIRRFRPDVILARFPPPPGDGGHGQHTAVGYLGPDAFRLAADPTAFPEQIKEGLQPWQAKRYYWNTFQFGRPREGEETANPDRLQVDTGEYDPVLGKSYAEVAGESRSMHRSQGMGTNQRKGSVAASFDYVAGDKAQTDLFDGIDTSWSRVDGGEAVGKLLSAARERYQPKRPEAILPLLLEAWQELGKLEGPWAEQKRKELARAITLASGVWLDAKAAQWDATPGSTLGVELEALRRGAGGIKWLGTELRGLDKATADSLPAELPENEVVKRDVKIIVPGDADYSQPPWLETAPDGWDYRVADKSLIGRPEAPPVLQAVFHMAFNGVEVPIVQDVSYEWVDSASGEKQRDLQVVPRVAVSFSRTNLVFPNQSPRTVQVLLSSHSSGVEADISLSLPAGWSAKPASIPLSLQRKGQETTAEFEVQPPAAASDGTITAVVKLDDGTRISRGIQQIEHEHIPIQVVYPPAELRVERIDVKLLSHNIGYVMGAGDEIPAALRELGAAVTLLSDKDLAGGDLSRFDAIVAGVRALNTRPALLAARERVMDYVKQGGTFVMQYNVFSRRSSAEADDVMGPYPLEPYGFTHDRGDRITEEDAPIIILNPDSPLLNEPNKISPKDFEGWVQERGLYFMGKWDPRYQTVWASHDQGQEPVAGGMLYAKYGKGAYVFTGYSWFRQLPAGVPGAYRLFANIVSAGKTAEAGDR